MTTTDHFLTPREVCARWRINIKTLDKLALPWFYVSPQVRRIEVAVVVRFEQEQRLRAESAQGK